MFSSTVIIVCIVSSIVFLSIGYGCGWFGHKHKQSRASKATIIDLAKENSCHDKGSQQPPTPGPLYEELHQDAVELNQNVAYGPIAK